MCIVSSRRIPYALPVRYKVKVQKVFGVSPKLSGHVLPRWFGLFCATDDDDDTTLIHSQSQQKEKEKIFTHTPTRSTEIISAIGVTRVFYTNITVITSLKRTQVQQCRESEVPASGLFRS